MVLDMSKCRYCSVRDRSVPYLTALKGYSDFSVCVGNTTLNGTGKVYFFFNKGCFLLAD